MLHKKMHIHEINITIQLVKQLIETQFPQWRHLTIKPIQSSGTDNVIYQLGKDMCVRLPRVLKATEHIPNEQNLLSRLAFQLPLLIPTFIAQGSPDKMYPSRWFIYTWIQGQNAFVEHNINLHQAAIDLAFFLRTLQNIDSTDERFSRRGVPIETQDNITRHAIEALSDFIDTQTITILWEQCLKAPSWDKSPVWIHGDLLPTNILVQNNRLCGIIDFDFLGVGDPACDLLPAWSLFTSSTREIFRMTLAVDDATWVRGKGWALSIALVIIPYYKNSNPTLVTIAKRIINELITDFNLLTKNKSFKN